MGNRYIGLAAAVAALVTLAPQLAQAQGSCGFDAGKLSFRGNPVEQARCLMRPVRPGGVLGPVQALPAGFEAVLGQAVPVPVPRSAIQQRAETLGLAPDAAGGPLDQPLSRAEGPGKPVARYFVIHDTSLNRCDKADPFAGSDAADAAWNRASTWQGSKQAHLFITRDGKLVAPQGRTFATPWRATKLEATVGTATRGLFLHVENVQLRRVALAAGQKPRKPDGSCINDRIAQSPGLSPAQLEKLALVYVAASHRAGQWMIPAQHAAMDEGLSDGHDDPQNFDVHAFWTAVCTQLSAMGKPCP